MLDRMVWNNFLLFQTLVLLGNSRNILCATKLHLTLRQHGGTEF